jgi:glycosyltransferase involved in cell wall biosynthesis
MKIALISMYEKLLAIADKAEGVDGGGGNGIVANLAVELGRHGHEVTVYTRRDSAGLPRQMRLAKGVAVEYVSAGPDHEVPEIHQATFIGEFARYLRRKWHADPPDIAHAHSWMSGLAALAGAAGRSFPVVQTYHALSAVERRHRGESVSAVNERIRIERSIGKAVHAVIATCADEMSALTAMGVPRRRISVVPCGVDVGRFRPQGSAYPVGGGSRLVAVSRLVESKGVDTAVEALGYVPNAKLVIVGGPTRINLDSDPEVHRLRMRARDADVADRVTFLGRVVRSDVPSLLHSADLVLSLPWYDPLGIVALEAMACGIPVVASGVGGQLDTVVDHVTGIHVPPRQPRLAARVIRDLLADPTRRQTLGIAGADRAQARYSWDRIARETTAIYLDAMQEVRSGRPAA